MVIRGGRVAAQQIAPDAFGNAVGESIASQSSSLGIPEPVSADERTAILDMFAKDAPISPAERASILAMFEGGPGSGTSSRYSGGKAWAADVEARRAAAKAGQSDALRASIASSGVTIDSRPGSIYVQRGDDLSKIAARFPEYGSTNDLKNQLIAANPWLTDPNKLREGMELKFPDAGTVVDRAAMARAAGADARYQAALAAHQPEAQEPVWSFREASMAQRKLDDAQAIAALQSRLANGPGVSAWNGMKGDGEPPVSPSYRAITSALGMIADGLGVVQGAAITFTGFTLTATPEPTTLTKWAGVPLTAYGATFTAKSAAGFGLNASNFVTAIRGSTLASDYVPGSALEMAVQIGGGSPEAQRLAVAGDMAWGLATGKTLDARVATGIVSNPRVSALLQAPSYTTPSRQAKLVSPDLWNMVTRVEPRASLLDLSIKSYENVWQPLSPKNKD